MPKFHGPAPPHRWLPVVLTLTLIPGCNSLSEHRRIADKEALGIIGEKQKEVFGEKRPFTVDTPADSPADQLREAIKLAAGGKGKPPKPLKINLARLLEIAALTSRDLQNQKETLFLSALSLSTTRYDYGWTKLTVGGNFGADDIRADGDPSTSTDASGSATLGYSKKALFFGASILGSLIHNFSRNITSSESWDASSLISLGLTQPLLQGFGSHIVLEALTQAERDVIYDLRNFERFRRALVVDLTSDYFSLLQQKDRLAIEQENLANLKRSLKELEAKKDAHRVSKLQVDQTRQSVLRSEATLVSLQESSDGSLDNFKITLGLPVEAEITLDMKEFNELRKKGIPAQEFNPVRCTEIALSQRLDLKTSRDQLADDGRGVVIAVDAMKDVLDIELDVDVPAKTGKSSQPDWRNATFGAGLSWSIPLDKTPQRNSYRRALIAFERSRRNLELKEDSVRREVRSRLRSLSQIRQDYLIQKNSVALARERVDETEMKQQMGRAIMRDVLEARESLVATQSSLSNLILNYLTERLAMLRDLEILRLDKKDLKYDAEIKHYTEFL